MQGGDQVVVLFAGFIVQQGFAGRALFQHFLRDPHSLRVRIRAGRLAVQHSHLQCGQRCPGISVGKAGDQRQHAVFYLDRLFSEAPGIVQRALQQGQHILFGESLQHEHLAAGQKRPVHLERRVFGRCADQDDGALFHERQESVLLRLIEAVDLVDEQDGLFPKAAALVRLFHHFLDLLDAAGDGGEIDEARFRMVRDDPCQRRLAYARRTPEDHGRHCVLLDDAAQHSALPEQMLLPYDLVDRLGTHAGRERLRHIVFE